MRHHAPRGRHACVAASGSRCATPVVHVLLLLLALTLSLIGVTTGAARQADSGYSPASGPAHVIAQGVVALPTGDVVWRTIRTRALLPDEAPFEERPLGLVLASSGPLMIGHSR